MEYKGKKMIFELRKDPDEFIVNIHCSLKMNAPQGTQFINPPELNGESLATGHWRGYKDSCEYQLTRSELLRGLPGSLFPWNYTADDGK